MCSKALLATRNVGKVVLTPMAAAAKSLLPVLESAGISQGLRNGRDLLLASPQMLKESLFPTTRAFSKSFLQKNSSPKSRD